MKKWCVLPLFLAVLGSAWTARGIQELSIRSSVNTAEEALTTENAWRLDPHAENPHRRAWVLKRRVTLKNLRAEPVDNTYFRPVLDGILSDVTIHARADARRYSDLADFPCTPSPTEQFATQLGSIRAAEEAARLWNDALAAARDDLAVRIGRIRADSQEKALRIAEYHFKQWQRDVEVKWLARADALARKKEWAYYRTQAESAGLCKAGAKSKADARRWEQLIEPVTSKKDQGEMLVRVPARRWNGVFGVRATIEVGGLRLNGHFILDTTSPRSMVSPSWLESQGMNPQVLEAFSESSEKFNWIGGTASGKRVVVDSLEISSYPFDLDEFYLVETKIFLPPQSISPCCDGVLGRDFLMNHPIEFNPGAERDFVKIFARSGFTRAIGTPWVEASVKDELLVSDCVLQPARAGARRLSILRGVSWLSASAESLGINPAASGAERWNGADGSIECGNLPLIQEARVAVRKGLPYGNTEVGVGMGVLGRGPFTLDLPHGRIWISKEALRRDVESNQSGLVLDFTIEKGARTLRVKEIRPQSLAAGALVKEGIKPGARILEINGKEAADLDLWNANRYLTGVRGERITLKVARNSADKLVPLKVR